MSGIVAVAQPNKHHNLVSRMDLIGHRGPLGRAIVRYGQATLGEVRGAPLGMWTGRKEGCRAAFDGAVFDRAGDGENACDVSQMIEDAFERSGPAFLSQLDGPFALAIGCEDGVFAARDPVGIAPLYYGFRDGVFCCASEAKALLGWASEVREFPPGHYFSPEEGLVRFVDSEHRPGESEANPAGSLLEALSGAVLKRVALSESPACLLSGGVDSSIIAAIAARGAERLKTFAIGLDGAPDLRCARQVAEHIGSEHFEVRVKPETLLRVLPDVIYHLESFDALLVRSSLTNYLLCGVVSDHADGVLSGEGSDELFAGYDYMKQVPTSCLNDELADITGRLHNTGLQRVDRCAGAHGLKAFVPFLDPEVRSLARSMGPDLKIRREDGEAVDKWVLRRASEPLLPDGIARRPKAKFWQGTGVTDVMAGYAESRISDEAFRQARTLSDGTVLNTREECLYYNVFTGHFGQLEDYSLVGRTKTTPPA